MLLGNEASDTGDYQVGIRLAHLLGLPVATGIKSLSIAADGTSAQARREYRGVTETYQLPLPAVVTVKEGINLPRYPSLPGRLRAKRAVIERVPVEFTPEGLRRRTLRVPVTARHSATVLGHGVDAVPEMVRVLRRARGALMTVYCLVELDAVNGGPAGWRVARRSGRLPAGAHPRAGPWPRSGCRVRGRGQHSGHGSRRIWRY